MDATDARQIVREGMSQESYEGTPYEDSSWEIVGDFAGETPFEPMAFEVLDSGEQITTDPMFADYGGLPEEKSVKRWHLPGDLAYHPPEQEQLKEVEEVDNSIKVQPEELERMLAEAEARGRAAGLEDAVAQNIEKMQAIEERFTSVLTDMDAQRKADMATLEAHAVELALNVARRVVTFAVEINPEYIVEIVKEALSHSGGAKIKKVRVSPEDMEFIEVVGVEKRMREFDGSWRFEKDETIKSGCIVDTSAGEIEFDLDRAWERIKENVIKVVR